MDVPNILLREFNTAGVSGLIPGKIVRTYKDLEAVSFQVFCSTPADSNLHFHLGNGECDSEGQVLPFLWDSARYFDDAFLRGGKLHVFAHFELANGCQQAFRQVNGENKTAEDSDGDSVFSPHVDELQRKQSFADTPSNKCQRAPLVQLVDAADSLQKNVSGIPEGHQQIDTSTTPQGHQHIDTSTTPQGHLQTNGLGTISQLSSFSFNPAQHAADFIAARASNPAPGEYGHRDNWDDLGDQSTRKIAHAILIKGDYGVPAPTSCIRCMNRGVVCRIYHPALNQPGSSCGECRLVSQTCSISNSSIKNSPIQPSAGDNGRKKFLPERPTNNALKRPMDQLHTPNGNAQKANKVSSQSRPNAQTLEGMYYCPVEGCDRYKDGFTRNLNYLQHMQTKHPDSGHTPTRNPQTVNNLSSQRRPNAQNPEEMYYCPAKGCDRHDEGFTRYGNFKQHMEAKHPGLDPDGDHDTVVVQSPYVSCPLEQTKSSSEGPSLESHAVEFDSCLTVSALPGQYGHRENFNEMKSSSKRRIAHSRLIRGRYGVPSMPPCERCTANGFLCRVYHPRLAQQLKLRTCGECQMSGQACRRATEIKKEVQGNRVTFRDPGLNGTCADEVGNSKGLDNGEDIHSEEANG
ncbi:hypothetical protein GQ43DRAFT_479578 [Delitschia confertaspora ATCC 74209]|uniref:C2H2-type domain-containing protein n=1 Tax=Delitschia confertaspora ATCC 74209 TaxID=1513339 RepID=A0A9P4JT77_9PLEO|nr:hypothetical protein GQ43DRAFT_479578 [Delitschia confertaspora ATCC 74209]